MSSAMSSSSSSAAEVAVDGVVPTTSCAWEQVGDRDTCYTQPRSCYNCLNTALDSGEECVLMPHGLCQDVSEYDYTEDWRRAGAASRYPIHYNYFPEANTTYCEADDAVCRSCQQTVFTVGNNNPSIFCEGSGGCVCVAICESERWWNETLARLATALANANETTSCPLAANSSSTSASSSSGAAVTSATKDVYASDDECKWYQNSTRCETPRSCYDCLNTALYSGQKCTITPGGYCTTMDAYDYTRDYRRVYSDSAAHYFPSANTTYCEANDESCVACRESSFTDAFDGDGNLTQYCTGTSNCVCVAFCESPNWLAIVTEETCQLTQSASDKSDASGIPSIAIAAIVVMVVLLSVSGLMQLLRLYQARRRQTRWEHTEAPRREPRRAPASAMTLELSAWKEMRDEIIDGERKFAGEDSLGPRLAGATDDIPTVTIEDGDGYRPMSPNVPVVTAPMPTPTRVLTSTAPPSSQRASV